jgi:adenylate cyclase
MGGDPVQAKAEIDRALELNPSSADILDRAAWNLSYLGKPEEGAALCDRAFRLNPLPPPWYPSSCKEDYFFTKRYRDAVDMVKRQAAWHPLIPYYLGWLAAAQIELGAVDDAAATVADWKHRFPDATVEELLSTQWVFSRQQEEDQFLASLQKAGAPICVPSDKLANFPKLKHLAVCDAQRAKEASQ